mgnify:CR=1 FL=1
MTEYITTTPLQTSFSKTIIEQPTLRDQFAMAALTGMIQSISSSDWKKIAAHSYQVADAMLAAREEKK